jgi:Family of unknown function (DUF5771)
MASRRRSSPKRSKRRSPSRKRGSKKRSSKSRIYSASRPLNLKKSSLSKHGYSTKAGVGARHAALTKAVHAYGGHAVWSKLNLISILNKNRSPATSTIMTRDKNWVKRTYL